MKKLVTHFGLFLLPPFHMSPPPRPSPSTLAGTKRSAAQTRSISPPPLKRKAQSSVSGMWSVNQSTYLSFKLNEWLIVHEWSIIGKSVAEFFTPISSKRKPETTILWRIVGGSLLVGRYKQKDDDDERKEGGKKVVLFDLVCFFFFFFFFFPNSYMLKDSTLISTASGNTFARNASDWKWWHASVPIRLRELNSKGYVYMQLHQAKLTDSLFCLPGSYQVIIVSNQKKVSIMQKDAKTRGGESKSLSMFKEKMTAVLRQLDIPLSVYAATEDDGFRKPRLGMWRQFLEDYHLSLLQNSLDWTESFCVGDAAGRVKDFSNSDRYVNFFFFFFFFK